VILKSKQKSLCQLATTELFPKEIKNRETERKLQKCVWVLCFRLVLGSQSLKLKYENYKSVEILSNFQNVKSPCANVIPHNGRHSGDGSDLKLTSFRVTVSLRSILFSLKK